MIFLHELDGALVPESQALQDWRSRRPWRGLVYVPLPVWDHESRRAAGFEVWQPATVPEVKPCE